MSTAICFNLDQSKILLSGNGLIEIESRRSSHIVTGFGYLENEENSAGKDYLP